MSGRQARRVRRGHQQEIRVFLDRVMAGLRALLKQKARAYYEAHPDARRPCRTCAFNPATDGDRGFDTTVWGLAHSIVSGQRFWCHENLPKGPNGDWMFDPRVAKRCAGWAVIQEDPAAKRAIVRGLLLDPGGHQVSDAQVDALVNFARDTMPPAPAGELAPGVTVDDMRRVGLVRERAR